MYSLALRILSFLASAHPVFSPIYGFMRPSALSTPNYLLPNSSHSGALRDLAWRSGRKEESLQSLKLVQFIFRHGDRNSHVYIKSPALHWIPPMDGVALLTETGKVELMELGQMLRARYDGFLSLQYDLDQILMKAPEFDRCIMSANALLSQLFPDPFAFPPVHTISKQVDNVLNVEQFPCLRYQELLRDAYREINAWTHKEQKSVWAEVSRILSIPIKHFTDLMGVYDNLKVMRAHGLPLPAGISPSILELLGSDFMDELKSRFVNPEMEELYVGPLFEELVSNMELALGGNEPVNGLRRSYGFAGRDYVIAALLSSWRMFNHIPPPFGSTIIIELHQRESNMPEVQFFYRNDTRVPPMELRNSACGHPCLLSNLKKAYSRLLNVTSDYEQRCRAK